MNWFVIGMQYGLVLSLLIWAWRERVAVWRFIRHVLSWMLVPYIGLVAVIWCVLKVKNCRIEPAVKRHLDKIIYWNDTVLMRKEN